MRARRLFPVLALLFLLGGVGRILLHPATPKGEEERLLFECEALDPLLLSSLPKEGETLRVHDTQGILLSAEVLPVLKRERERGTVLSFESVLEKRVRFAVSLPVSEKSGRLYLGEKYLPVGAEVTLTSAGFTAKVRLVGLFSDQKGTK